jgi:hypothetical protein
MRAWPLFVAIGLTTANGGAIPVVHAQAPEPVPPASEPAQPSEPAAPPLDPQQVVTGIEDEGRDPGDTGRDVASALLWLPRNLIDYTFRGTAIAATVIADEQIVPRYRDAIGAPKGGDIWVFPTLFVDTGSAFSVGARAIFDTPTITTSQRFGFGGTSDIVTESRVLFKGGRQLPFLLSLEAYYEIESELEYYGLGLAPERDDRNDYRPGRDGDIGLYTEQHLRGIGSLGLRLAPSLEFFLSASLARRQVEDAEDVGRDALSRVFEPGSIAGVTKDTWVGYSEMAVRFDSRKYRGRPSSGALVEGYTGGAHSVDGQDVAFMRFGWRAAGFIPIYRETNIFSPRVVLDRLLPLGGVPVPFNQYPGQPDFRGFDTRRDLLSIVVSLDYSWQLVPFMGTRLFFDIGTVSDGFAGFSLAQLKDARYAGGFAIDFYTDTTLVAQFALSQSTEGPRLLLTVGAPEGFGDRQHRD